MPSTLHKKKHKKKKKAVLPIHPQDKFALERFFQSTGGSETWINKDHWCSSQPLEKWNGVIVDKETGRVTELWLRYNGLVGGIPDSLGLLLCLRHVDLEGNEFGGTPLPAALGNLSLLESFWITDCGINIPPGIALKCGSRDQVLTLFRSVGGDIMAKDRGPLAKLFCSFNGLKWRKSDYWCSSRPLHEWYGVTTHQVTKKMKPKQQKDNISATVYANSNNSKIINGVSSASSLDGSFEPYIRKIGVGRVTKIYLGGNGLEGELTEECGLGELTELQKLSLYGNYLKGELSPILCRLVRLNYIDIEENYFVSIPVGTSFECKTVDDVRDFHYSMGYESIVIEELTKDKSKELEKKNKYDKHMLAMSGKAQDAPSSSPLAVLMKKPVAVVVARQTSGSSSNKQGHASLKRSKEQALEILKKEKHALLHFIDRAGRYHCKGRCPGWCSSDGWSKKMEEGEKEDQGEPGGGVGVSDDWFGLGVDSKNNRLRTMKLPSNRLFGNLSKMLTPLCGIAGKLVVLDLRCNLISGEIPPAIGFLSSLVEVYLSLNQISGRIPEEFGSLLRLEKLGLGGNKLQGLIPHTFARLTKLNYFDVSLNPLLLADTLQDMQSRNMSMDTNDDAHAGAAHPSSSSSSIGNNSQVSSSTAAPQRVKAGNVNVIKQLSQSGSVSNVMTRNDKLSTTSNSKSNLVLECNSHQAVLTLFMKIGVLKQQPAAMQTSIHASSSIYSKQDSLETAITANESAAEQTIVSVN